MAAARKPAKKRAAKTARKTAGKPAKKTTRRKKTGKIWLKSYPEGVPHELPELEFGSLAEMIEARCAQHAGRPAYSCMGKTLSFSDLDRLSAAFAAFLASKGLQKGDRVAVMMPNILQYPVSIFGILRAGFVVVNVNPLYTPRELEHQLRDSGARAIIVLENFASTLAEVVDKVPLEHVIVATMGDLMGLKGIVVNFVCRRVKKVVPEWHLPGHIPYRKALSSGAMLKLPAVDIRPSDLAFLQYTGGTTGVSKGASLTNANILSNILQNTLWMEVAYRARGRPDHLNYVCALPLYHIFALTVNAMVALDLGGHNILIPNPRDIPSFVKDISRHELHIFPALNTLFIALLNNEQFTRLDFSKLLLTLGGGMAVQKAVASEWQDVTGCMISEGYGLSETSPVATVNRFDATEFTGTIGLPVPSTDIAIRDEKGRDLAPGKTGEICIRGPQVMAGYWQRPEATAEVMTPDGFFKTGDMGLMDEAGYTRIVDRKKDMILVSGFNVFPNEIEDVAAMHPGILESAAIGVPDDYSGEVVKLFVVKKDPGLTEADVKAHCKKNLTGYKRPKYIEFRDELPKTNVGKILRRKLRDD